MHTILIIYPHWHPCNLAGVHRPRLLANYLTEFGWQPVVLTVKEEYFEEEPDTDFYKTFSDKIIVHRVKAFKANRKFNPVGDIGLRAFWQLYKGALKIIDTQKIDFIFIPIPSFYCAILGRILFIKRKIPYGIDYIDPWVRPLHPYQKKISKAGISLLIAKLLEPFAVKKASLISGVSTSYYQPVLDRNFKNKPIFHVGMPYGFDENDHKIALENIQFPWNEIENCIPIVYAGAFLPKSVYFIEILFKIIKNLIEEKQWNKSVHLFFLGTGHAKRKSIQDIAADYQLQNIIHEYTGRFPYLHILNFLSKSSGVMIIGSTEKHYTASKTFQGLLSNQPIFAILHKESSAVEILQHANAASYLTEYSENITNDFFEKNIKENLIRFIEKKAEWKPDITVLENYSAKNSTKQLVEKLNLIISNQKK